jgi:hypothetical protein
MTVVLLGMSGLNMNEWGTCYIVMVLGMPTWVREIFELNQLKSAPSQLLPVFSRFDRLQTCCHSFGPANVLRCFSSAG